MCQYLSYCSYYKSILRPAWVLTSSSDGSDSDGDGDSSSKKYKNKNKGHNIIMPDDIFLKIFILSFGALWVYIALKLMANMYKKR